MKAETVIALEASITSWKHKATTPDYKGLNMGPTGCALCQLFHHNECNGCPISEKTGRMECIGTPYEETYKAWRKLIGAENPNQIRVRRPKFREAARAMVEFMEDLRP